MAGVALTTLYSQNGLIGALLAPHGIKVAFTPLGITVALTFIGLPFVVRSVQPVLETLPKEIEEAAATLGADRWQTFRRVILPALTPALVAGMSLSFARAIGEYGSVVFISGNMPGTHRDRAAADHEQAGAVRLRRRDGDRGGDAADVGSDPRERGTRPTSRRAPRGLRKRRDDSMATTHRTRRATARAATGPRAREPAPRRPTNESARGAPGADRRGARVSVRLPRACRCSWCSRKRCEKGFERVLHGAARAGAVARAAADAARGGDRRAAERGVRHRGGVGDHEGTRARDARCSSRWPTCRWRCRR